MASTRHIENNIISFFGQTWGAKLISILDVCDDPVVDCSLVQSCETITTLGYSAINNVLTFTNEDGGVTTHTLNDKYLESLVYNDVTDTLVGTMNDGTILSTIVTGSGIGIDTNFAINDLTADADRVHDFSTFDLTINSTGEATHNFTRFNVDATQNYPIASYQANHEITVGEHFILVDASLNSLTISLPATTGTPATDPVDGDYYRVKCIDLTNAITMNPNGTTIDNGPNYTFRNVNDAYDFTYYNGKWWIF